jgi:hypothetical protein
MEARTYIFWAAWTKPKFRNNRGKFPYWFFKLIFFNNGLFGEIHSDTNRNVKQQIKAKQQQGPLKLKSEYTK